MEEKNIKFNLKMLMALKGMNAQQFSMACGIKENHFRSVLCGRSRLLATDLIKIVKFTGIQAENIELS